MWAKIAVIGMLLSITACASMEDFEKDYTPHPLDIEAIKSDRYGAVVVSFYGSCKETTVELQNIATKRFYSKTVYSLSGGGYGEGVNAGRTPIILPVHPGLYRFHRVRCEREASYATAYSPAVNEWKTHESISAWMLPMEVHGGEVVYPGTVKEDPYEKEYGKAIGTLEGLGGRKTRSFKRFGIYDILDETQTLLPQIDHLSPELSDRVVARVQPSPIDKQVVKQIIDDVFVEVFPTIPETDEEAEANLTKASRKIRSELEIYFSEAWSKALGVDQDEKIGFEI